MKKISKYDIFNQLVEDIIFCQALTEKEKFEKISLYLHLFEDL